MLRGRLPWGLGGAVYLLVCLFVRIRSFAFVYRRYKVVNAFNWGSGMLLNAVHLYWIVQVPSRVVVVAVIVKGYH